MHLKKILLRQLLIVRLCQCFHVMVQRTKSVFISHTHTHAYTHTHTHTHNLRQLHDTLCSWLVCMYNKTDLSSLIRVTVKVDLNFISSHIFFFCMPCASGVDLCTLNIRLPTNYCGHGTVNKVVQMTAG